MWLTYNVHFCKKDDFYFNVRTNDLIYVEISIDILFISFCRRQEEMKIARRRRRKTRTHTVDKTSKNAICNHTMELIWRPAHFGLLLILRMRKRAERKKGRTARQIEKFHQIQYVRAQANHEKMKANYRERLQIVVRKRERERMWNEQFGWACT